MKHITTAEAYIYGSPSYPQIKGYAVFTETEQGTAVSAAFYGLPVPKEPCKQEVFALHIHEGASCSGNSDDSFADAKSHYNPHLCPHPFHAGDLPPIFAAGNTAASAVLTDRFTPSEIIGRTIILHRMPDDLHSQPSGNAGEKIACGIIRAAVPKKQ